MRVASEDQPDNSGPLAAELAELRGQVTQLRSENARLLTLLKLTPGEARPPGPAQTALFDTTPGMVDVQSPPAVKVAFFRALFAARTDVYAVRWDNSRTGKAGWLPAVRGGWRKGVPAAQREYFPLTEEVLAAHLSGERTIGLYPLLDGDRCHWLAADFDGPYAMLDALAYLKAARAARVSAALEISRSGIGAHVWIFFTGPVAAVTARELGTGLLREAITLRGRMELSSYDRLFPSQDVLPTSGVGNLLAAPLQGRCRQRGATVFLDLATLEPHPDQWAYLSSLGRMTPREVERAARSLGRLRVGTAVDRLTQATSSRTQPAAPPFIRAALGADITVHGADLTPALAATLKHAASMPNPLFYERQRRRASTWNVPRFLRSYDETLDGGLVLPRGLIDTLTTTVTQAGSALRILDERAVGAPQDFGFRAVLDAEQQGAWEALTDTISRFLSPRPGRARP